MPLAVPTPQPDAVPSLPFVILFHHAVTAVLLCVPLGELNWCWPASCDWNVLHGVPSPASVPEHLLLLPPPPAAHPHLHWYTCVDGIVELNTMFLIARRQLPWRAARKMCSWLYWGTFIPMRCILVRCAAANGAGTGWYAVLGSGKCIVGSAP